MAHEIRNRSGIRLDQRKRSGGKVDTQDNEKTKGGKRRKDGEEPGNGVLIHTFLVGGQHMSRDPKGLWRCCSFQIYNYSARFPVPNPAV